MKKLSSSEIGALRLFVRNRGFKIFSRKNELNIVGIRANSTKPNRFDDYIVVFFRNDNGVWQGYRFNATTDAGTYWLKNPMQSKGTALLKEGQYINAYSIGLHRGVYEALVQDLKPVTVIRDYNRDAILDFNNGREETGFFGINLHRADKIGTTLFIDKHSAGCQVLSDSDDYDFLMQLAKRHRSLYGNTFTYTLIDQRSYDRRKKLMLLVVVMILLALIILFAWGMKKLGRLNAFNK